MSVVLGTGALLRDRLTRNSVEAVFDSHVCQRAAHGTRRPAGDVPFLADILPVAKPVAELLRALLSGSAERVDCHLGLIFQRRPCCFGIDREGVRRRGHVTDLEHEREVKRADRTVQHRTSRSGSR